MLRSPRSRRACLAALFVSTTTLHAGSAYSALPRAAAGQECGPALQQTAERVSTLPGATPSEVNDQLQVDYDEASSLVDSNPAACLAIVRKMNDVLRRYGAQGSAGGIGNAGSRGPGPGASQSEDAANTDPAPSAEQIAKEEAEERRRERLERAAHDQAEDARAVAAYGAAFKAYRVSMHAVAATTQPKPAGLGAVDKPIEEIAVIVERMENDILVNDNVDALHAKLEDAFLRVDALRKTVDREWQRWLAAEARRKAEIKKLEGNSDEMAPLIPAYVEANYKAAAKRYLEVQEELDQAEFAAKQARNKIDPWIHYYQPFRDMKPGYEQAYEEAYARHPVEQDGVRDKCDSMALAACTQLLRTTNARQKRELDAIFERYVIRK